MSTVAEHLAALEMYRHNRAEDFLLSEAMLLVRTHLDELVALIPAEEMTAARDHIEGILRSTNHPTVEAKIKGWRHDR